MTKKSIVRNLDILRSIRDRKRRRVNATTLEKINNVIELYEDRKISQMATAENLLNGLVEGKDKGMKAYEKAVAKYQEAEPIGERINVRLAVQKANEGRTRAVVKRKGKLYSVKYMLFSKERGVTNKNRSFVHKGKRYYPLLMNPMERTGSVKSQKWIEEKVGQRIFRDDKETEKDFAKLITIMRTDQDFDDIVKGELYHYVDAIKIMKAELIDESAEDYDIFADELTDAKHNVSLFNRYVQTELNPDCLRFKDAIKKKGHADNECWMNTLLDHYSETLFKHKRGSLARNMCREKILELIRKTDEEFKQNGASINEMERVFKEFKIKARLYDIDSNLIYKHDPENYNSKMFITFNGLVANSHIYTLNHNLKSIKARETGDDYSKNVRGISNNYHINERKEPLKYKMIKSIDDLLQLKEENEYKIILENNCLNKALHDLKASGYTPQIRYNAHRTTQIVLELTHKITEKKTKTVKYTIETQSLNEDKIDEDISVNTEEKHNKVSAEMFKFHKQLFNENFKSYYNETDVKILDECRTIVPNGRFYGKDTFDDIRKCSIDRRKAYSYQAKMISKVPVFKEFDVWQHYDYSKCDVHRNGNYSLYLVKVCQANVFFNKKFNLVYGKHLKELIKRGVSLKIIAYKKPSFIHKVKFNKALEELYQSKISDDETENNKVHKTIANIAFGLWEKSYNKKTVSRIFDNLKQALAHQRKYDGRIYVLDEVEMEKYQEWGEVDDLDGDDYFDDDFDYKWEDGKRYKCLRNPELVKCQEKSRDAKYYIVSVSGQRQMMNGFRHLKELLLQNHNFEMYDAYEKLKARGIKVYAVKTDAFHIAYEDYKKAKGFWNLVVTLAIGDSKRMMLIELRTFTIGKITIFLKYPFIKLKGWK